MRMSSRLTIAATIASTLSVVNTAWAQQMRGTVRDGASGEPIPSAVLLLLDSVGVTRARNITDQRGGYRIAAAAWMKRMRVVRIGFRPSEVALPEVVLPDDVATVDVSMTRIPTMLEPVHVSSGAKCSSRSDRIAALSLLEQARAGLLAAIVAQETRPAEMIRLRTNELMSADDEVTSLRVRSDSSARVGHAFQAARSAGDFVTLGFYDADGSGMLYAPDAETLLDDAFRDGYCFLLRGHDSKRPNAVGLGFGPAKTRKDRIDVDGTLWIDTLSRRLLEIRYDYVGFSRLLEQAHPGGRVLFHTLPNGVVVIDHWTLRMPSVEIDSSERSVGGRVRRMVVHAEQSGGVVARARWEDGFAWDAPLATLQATVLTSDNRPDPNRVLLLDETDYRASSDVNGILTIGRLVPGPYSAIMKDTTLDPLGITLQTSLKFVVADSETIRRTLVSPSAADYVEQACRRTGPPAPNRQGNWFIARVVDASGAPVKNTEWHVYTRKRTSPGDGPSTAGVQLSSGEQSGWTGIDNAGGTTSSDGLLQYCGGALHYDDLIRLETRLSKNDPWQVLEFAPTGPVSAVRMTVTPRAR